MNPKYHPIPSRCKKNQWQSVQSTWRDVLSQYQNGTKIRPIQFEVDVSFHHPSITPSDVAEFCGFDPDEFKYFMTKGVVIGYFDESLGDFINPRMNPAAGTVIHRSAAEQLREINKAQSGEIGSTTIGTIAGTDFEVVLSVKDVVSQHLSVIAATGAGKITCSQRNLLLLEGLTIVPSNQKKYYI
ncbi:MAG: hypothetical protein C4B59_15655 [Candidatus Methanogaster sp.]|uniref:Uncharacterized protein n=1 Tax=Candidatus Methanogaster sp. TaxID=3386292 RepID=A0AC61KYT0_9EURY|nr:MAG: hypothetical protein C4B59_15655 [ANME-2 cluster archaeon]